MSLFSLVNYAEATPQVLMYQGRITDIKNQPLDSSNVSFIFQILDPNAACVMYQESVTGIRVNKGLFEVAIGNGSVNYPLTPGATVLGAFENGVSKRHYCGVCTGYTCTNGSSFVELPTKATRYLHVKFHDGVGWKTISPDSEITTVPYAGYSFNAEKFAGKDLSEFLTLDGLSAPCGTGQALTYTSSGLACVGISQGTVADESVTTAKIADGAVTNSKIDSVAVGKVASSAGQFFFYAPNGVSCNSGEILKWANSRWECGTDNVGSAAPTVATDLVSLAASTGIVQRTAADTFTALGLSAPLSVVSNNIVVNQGSLGVLIEGGNTLGAAMTLGNKSSNTLGLKTADTVRMSISATGNVGIGVTPNTRLHVATAGASSFETAFLVRNPSTEPYSTVTTEYESGGSWRSSLWSMQLGTGKGSLFGITTSDTSGNAKERLRISEIGNLGVGTVAPESPLSVLNKTTNSGISLQRDIDTNAALLSLSTKDNISLTDPRWMLGLYGGRKSLDVGTWNGVVFKNHLTIAENGNVGIGAPDPHYILDVRKDDGDTEVSIMNGNSTVPRYPQIKVMNYLGTASGGAPSFTLINGRGRDGTPLAVRAYDVLGEYNFFGTSNNSYGINLGAQVRAVASEDFSETQGGTHMSFSVMAAGTKNLTEQLRIASTGNVGIGNNNPAYKLDVQGDISASGCLRSSDGVASGVCTSDVRLKKDLQSFDLGLDVILGIRPQYFRYNGLGEQPESQKLELGVIAQDVEKVAPQLIVEKAVKLHPEDTQKTEIKQVNYTAFVYVLMNSIKDLYKLWAEESRVVQRELASLKAENLEKDKKIQSLQERLEILEKSFYQKEKTQTTPE